MQMGITAENVAARYKISREMQDELATMSQQRAAAAMAAGRFREQIVLIEVKTRKGVALFDTDIQELGFDPTKVNLNRSGISLGHPVGATGAIIATKAIAELHCTGGRYALITMCIGGGQGIAAVLERV